ncbi:STN domain-containing protein, partial [Sphingomonas sp.]|uniref:STN domain-containing protein n=1 Tax=Sphingomonas sp. TaxID=28214 RepID=UPI0031D0F892
MFLAGAAIAGLGACLAATPAWAQAARQYSVPASDAGDAVQMIAQQSGLQVIAPAADLAGVRTNAIKGNFSAVEALRRMFAGTGLEVVQTAGVAVMIRRAAAPAA